MYYKKLVMLAAGVRPIILLYRGPMSVYINISGLAMFLRPASLELWFCFFRFLLL